MNQFNSGISSNNERQLDSLQKDMQVSMRNGVEKDKEYLMSKIDNINKKSKGLLGYLALSKGEKNLLEVAQQAEVNLSKTMSAANQSIVAIQCQSAIELTRTLHKALHHTFSANVQVGKVAQITNSKNKILEQFYLDNEKFAAWFEKFTSLIARAPAESKDMFERSLRQHSTLHFESQDKMLNDFLQGLDLDFKV